MTIARLSRGAAHRTSALMPELFDMRLRWLRRQRAARRWSEPFLLERALDDCLERIQIQHRRFERTLLIGCHGAVRPERWDAVAESLDVAAADIIEDRWEPPARAYDLVVAVGTLDTVNDLPLGLRRIRNAMRPDGLFIGALSGGDTLPQLRAAMRAADAVAGAAFPHVHPRIDASAMAPLLEQAGFGRPVVDIDRVRASYRSFGQLVADLRAMAATNVLVTRPRFIKKAALAAAIGAFAAAGDGERTIETFEIINFAAWCEG